MRAASSRGPSFSQEGNEGFRNAIKKELMRVFAAVGLMGLWGVVLVSLGARVHWRQIY